MRRVHRNRLAALIGLIVGTVGLVPVVAAADPPQIVVQDGVTQPVFGYADAIREHVWVDTDLDSDQNGVPDLISVDIIRPAATADGLKVPVIMDDSPYYTTLGRGNESERKVRDANGLLTKWPLFYDNYFVPRGYAVVLTDMTGTAGSTGCPTIQGYEENQSGPEVIDWLNGRRTAHDKDGNLVTVDWHNGKTGMIGKSYDGALAAGAASTGVEGLTTVVPISGPYNYYDYTRTNGVVMRGNNYLRSLAVTITNDSPARQAACGPIWSVIDATDGDENGDYSPFWEPRNYLKDVDKVKASVFLVHGINDENVRPDHMSKWWYLLAERNVPRKLWTTQTGHIDPFDFRRTEWVNTLHRWFDYWLQDVQNGIMDEPRATLEDARDVFNDYADWPLPGTVATDVYLQSGATATAAGAISLSSGGPLPTRTWTDANLSEANYTSLTVSQTNRLQFLSPVLTSDVRLSGTPTVQIRASSSNRTQTNLTALLIDYGTGTYVTRSGDGISQNPAGSIEDCFGLSSATDDPCYRRVNKVTTNVSLWRVAKGMLDSSNRNSLTTATPMTLGTTYTFSWPLLPNDFTFKAGHRIGIVIGGNFSAYGSTNGMTGAIVTLDTRASKMTLPIVGGYGALLAAGLPDTTAPILTTSPNVSVEATGPTTPVTYAAPVATDAEDPAPTASCLPASGSSFVVGTTTVACTAADQAGNTTAGAFDVTVTDTTPPAVDPAADIPGVEATGPAGAAVSFASPAAMDLVDGPLGTSCLPASGTTFPIGSTSVVCSATDSHANTASTAFVVTVVDTTAPVVDPVADITAEATGPAGAVVGFASPVAHDIVDGILGTTCSPTSGSTFAIGVTTVTCSVTDSHANTGSTAFSVTVQDTTPPTLHLPAPITVNATMPSGAVVTWIATATDIVDGTDPVTCSPASGSVIAIGTTTVSCSSTDSHGNTATGSITVHVKSATEQLADLLVASTRVGTGTSLADKVRIMQDRLAAGQLTLTCNDLRNSYPNQLLAQLGKKLSPAQAAALIIDSNRIADVLGCP